MPERTPEEFKEHLRSLGFSKQQPSKTTAVIADDGPYRGQKVGKTIEHSDGRVDATVTRPFVEHKMNKKGHS